MATLQSNHVCDSSTLANFKDGPQSISTAFSTFGWSQSGDTGQANWSTLAVIPTGSTWAYEIWQPNDGLTTFYVKVEYGNNGTTNSPTIRISIGTGTNGAGTLTGTTMGPYNCALGTFTAPSSTLTYECDYSGAAGRISILMWRNGTNSCQQVFAIERSVNSSGTYTSTYVTLVVGGKQQNGFTDQPPYQQQSLVFGVGVTPSTGRQTSAGGAQENFPCLGVRRLNTYTNSSAFNSSIPFDTAAPCIGYYDYPMTSIGVANAADVTEGVVFSVTLYGSTRAYMPTKNGALVYVFNNGTNPQVALCVRYD